MHCELVKHWCRLQRLTEFDEEGLGAKVRKGAIDFRFYHGHSHGIYETTYVISNFVLIQFWIQITSKNY